PMPAENYDFTSLDTGIATTESVSDGWVINPNTNDRYGEMSILLGEDEYTGILKVNVKQANKLVVPMVAAGTDHILALKSDGTVWSWGKNDKGQLGNGATNSTEYPAKIIFPTNADGTEVKFMAISAGNKFSVAVSTTGDVYTWGWNEYGQLGNGHWNDYYAVEATRTTVWGNCCYDSEVPLDEREYRNHDHVTYTREQSNYDVLTPQKLTTISDVVAVSSSKGTSPSINKGASQLDLLNMNASGAHTIALKKDGTVWAWGLNNKGQIGNNTVASVTQLALGYTTNGFNGEEHDNYPAASVYTYIPQQENLYITEPVQVKGLEGIGYLSAITEISAGGNSSVAVRGDGYVYTWGDNSNGQLGEKSQNNSIIPVQVMSGEKSNNYNYFRDALYVAMGGDHAVVSTRDGHAYAWGSNTNGQLGNGKQASAQTTPVAVKVSENELLSDVVYVSAAGNHSHATTLSGDVYSWGINTNGQMANGTASGNNVYAATVLPGETEVIDNSDHLQYITRVYPGEYDAMAMRYDGSVYGWGYYGVGQFIDNIVYPIFMGESPAKIFAFQEGYNATSDVTYTILPNYNILNTNSYLSVVLSGDNGMIDKEYLGFNLLNDVNAHPTTDFDNLEFKSSNEDIATVVKDIANNVATITSNNYRRYGEAVITARNPVTGYYGMFVVTVKPDDAASITAPMVVSTSNAAYALKSDGSVWMWGADSASAPKLVAIDELIKYIAAGPSHVLAVDIDGHVWAWGDNSYGKLGIGNTSQTTTPTMVKGLNGVGYLENIDKVAAGNVNSAAIGKDGVVYVWGDNTHGQRGIELKGSNYSTVPRYTVKGASAGDNPDGALNDFIDITIGSNFISALRKDGNVFSWGNSDNGQTAKGLYTEALAPVQAVRGESESNTAYLKNIINIEAGANHVIALSDDNTVYSWGYNSNGQLGNNTSGTSTNKNIPIKVLVSEDGNVYEQLSDIVNIDAGVNSSMAVRRNGCLLGWGDAANNQLGNGSTTNRLTPVYVNRGESFYSDEYDTKLGWITDVTVNSRSASAIRYDGSVYSWGYNGSYDIGDFTSKNRATPVQTGVREDRRIAVNIATLYTDGAIDTVYDSSNPLPQKITLAPNQYLEIDKNDLYDYHMTGFNVIRNFDKLTIAEQAHYAKLTEDDIKRNITFTTLDNSTVSVTDSSNVIKITPNQDAKYATTYITMYNTSTNYVGVLEVSVKPEGTKVMPMIVSGDNHTLALMSDGTVWAWGANTYGQLGNGIRSNEKSQPSSGNEERNDFIYPIKVNIPADVVIKSVAAGKRHSLALTTDGNVYIWGYTEPKNIVWGDRRQNNIVTRTGAHKSSYTGGEKIYGIVTPTLVKLSSDSTQNLTDIISIAAGDDVSYAVKADGTVWAWGHNGPTGKLGINKYDTQVYNSVWLGSYSSVTFTIPSHWEYNEWVPETSDTISTGYYGTSYEWYTWSEYGSTDAQQVVGPYAGGKLNNAVAVRTAGDSAYVIKADGTVWSWGSNAYHVLANEYSSTDTSSGRLGYPLQVYKGDSYSVDKYLKNIVDLQVGSVNRERTSREIGVQATLDDTSVTALARTITLDDTTHKITHYDNSGHIYSWGLGTSGQLGTGNDESSGTPVSVITGDKDADNNDIILKNVTAVSAGGNTAMAIVLNDDGITNEGYSWGANNVGQLGINSTDNSNTPVRIVKGQNLYTTDDYIKEPVSIASGAYYSTAILRDGTIWAWGQNRNGQLGNNYRVNEAIPVQTGDRAAHILTAVNATNTTTGVTYEKDAAVNPLTPVITITEGEELQINNIDWEYIQGFEFLDYAANGSMTVADGFEFTSSNTDIATVDQNGKITANRGLYGQTTISFKKEITAPDDGRYTGLVDDPHMYGGQLIVKVIQTGDDKIAVPAVKGGNSFFAALMDNGTVWAWGYNEYGQLGDNTKSNSFYPVQVRNSANNGYLDNIVEIDTGDNHVIALDRDGNVWTWGNGTVLPTKISIDVPIVAVAAGANHSVALASNGNVYAWGDNSYGQIGQGTAGISVRYEYTGPVASYGTPQLVKDLNNGRNGSPAHSITSIAAGGNSTMLIRADGTAFTFGLGSSGQLGYGNKMTKNNSSDTKSDTYHKVVSAQVINRTDDYDMLAGGIANVYMQNIAEADMGSSHSIILLNNNTAYTAGLGTSGQLGNGDSFSSSEWIKVKWDADNALEDIMTVSAGYDKTAAITEGENLYAWGGNTNAELGDTNGGRVYPAQIVKGNNKNETGDYFTKVEEIALGNTASALFKTDGTVWAFGKNSVGQFGDFINNSRSGAYNVGPVDYYALDFNEGQLLLDDGSTENIDKIGLHYRLNEENKLVINIDAIKIKYVPGFNLLNDMKFYPLANANYSYTSSDERVATVEWVNGLGAVIKPVGGHYGKVSIIVTDETTGYSGEFVVDVIKTGKIAVPMIANGVDFTVALKADGTVWTWGNNASGQLGIGYSTLDQDGKIDKLNMVNNSITRVPSWAEPIQVADSNGLGYLRNIVSIAAGNDFVVALKSDGTVYSWGNGTGGRLGTGSTGIAYQPTKVLRGASDSYVTEDDTEYLSGIIEISAGMDYALALTEDGHVLAWGVNTNGKLGDNYRGAAGNKSTPVYVTSGAMAGDTAFTLNADETNSTRATQTPHRLSNIVTIEAGNVSSFAIADNSSIYAWGDNTYNHLGIGTLAKTFVNYDDTNYTYVPIQVQKGNSMGNSSYDDEFMYNAVQSAIGTKHSYIRTNEGGIHKVYGMGTNDNGQLGTIATTSVPTYLDVDGNGTSVYDVTAGGNNSAFITDGNIIYTVGANGYGQLGVDSKIGTSTPLRVHDSVRSDVGDLLLFEDAFIADYGKNHLTIMKEDGSVYATGMNTYGELGDYTKIDSPIPVHVSKEEVKTLELENVEVKDASGNIINAYITPDYLELTDGQYVDFNKANIKNKRIVGFNLYEDDEITEIADPNSLSFVSSDITIGNFAAGSDELHQTSTPAKAGPTIVTITNPLNGYKAHVTVTMKGENVTPSGTMVSAGKSFTVALKEDGTVWSWGNNTHGQLGDGTLSGKKYPVQVVDAAGNPLKDIVMLSAGDDFVFAVAKDGTLYTWGVSVTDGTDLTVPTAVSTADLDGAITGMDAGADYLIVLTEHGSVFSYGYDNAYGQLGIVDAVAPSASFNKITNLQNIKSIAAGDYHNMAVDTSGKVYTWGRNNRGQLGRSTKTTSGGSSGTGSSSGDGSGDDTGADAGDGDDSDEEIIETDLGYDWKPEEVAGLSDVLKISAGSAHSVALKADGTVWTWGDNTYGQLGNNDATVTESYVPVQVAAGAALERDRIDIDENTSYLSNIIGIYAGGNHTLVITNNYEVYTWGADEYGQLGVDATREKYAPVKVLKGYTFNADADEYLKNVIGASVGTYHTVVIRDDGYVWGFGRNDDGQLANITTTAAKTPVQAGDTDSNTLSFQQATVYVDENSAPVNYSPLPEYITIDKTGKIEIDIAQIYEHYLTGFNLFNKAGASQITSSDVSDIGNIEFTSSVLTVATVSRTGDIATITPAGLTGTTAITFRNKRNGYVGIINVTVKGEGEHRIVASALAAGTNFQVALKADGTVWTWGNNAYGQLGDGTKITRGFPVQVKKPDGAADRASVFTTATAIAAGTKHMLIVADGFVYAAGDNTYGQLGNGETKTTESIVVPVMVDETTPLSNVVAVAAGDNFSMALRNDGTVWTWGDNTSGQLGDGTTTTSAYAVQVLKGTSGTNSHEDNEYYLSNISAIAAGASFSAALKSDGTVYTWGNNSKGQLGDGTAVNKPTPVQVLRGESPEEAENVAPAGSDYIQNITKIAAGNNHMLALSKTGYVWSWGDNTYGQNGDWTTENNTKHYVPLQVRNISSADQVSGNTTGKLSNISSVAAKNNQSFAITNDGYLYAWGYDGLNQLGLGNTTANETLPKLVLKGAVQSDDEYIKFVSNVASGINNTVAELSDGYVYTWSRNTEWQLGKFDAYDVNTPAYTGERPEDLLEFFSDDAGETQIEYLTTIATGETIEIKAIKYHHMYGFNLETDDTHTLATDDTFTYKSSNDNVASVDTNGVITAGTQTGTVVITVTSEKTGITSSISLTVKQSGRRVMPMVSGGNAHAVALRDNGDVYVWGRNNEGQLGDGTTVSKMYPIKVNFPGGEAIKYVHAGMNVTYAVTEDGKVYAWGQNTNGLIGNGTTDSIAHSTPELVQEMTSTGTLQPLSGIARIESGNTHTLALTNDGHVYAWGQNTYGQLGNGDTSNSDQIFRDANTPAGIYAAQKVYRGESASESSAELDSWYIQDVIDIAAGNSFSAALKADGTVWTWGLNNNYQLGINDTVTRPVPMQVYAGASSGMETYLKNITAIAAGEAHV
ncbi:MAG: hypothetical protein MR413_04525, partial [Clostridia bacterium]|nr:hypothetical protein [Clostridia bacterium]